MLQRVDLLQREMIAQEKLPSSCFNASNKAGVGFSHSHRQRCTRNSQHRGMLRYRQVGRRERTDVFCQVQGGQR